MCDVFVEYTVGEMSSVTIKVDLPFQPDWNEHYVNNKIEFTDALAVPDVCRDSLGIKDGIANVRKGKKNIPSSRYNDCEIKDGMDKKTIVLLLESPHAKEYNTKDGLHEAIAPAQGTSGINIQKNIRVLMWEILNNHYYSKVTLPDCCYPFVICNPIQWQTSLAFYLKDRKLNKEVRDRIWNGLWDENALKNNFKERMKSYKPALIINACTSRLKEAVQSVISDTKCCLHKVPQVSVYHPSYWRFPYGLTLKNT